MGKNRAQKKAEKRLERAKTSKTKIAAMRQESENKRIQIKSTTTLIEGLYGDYVRLCGAVNNLKGFAKVRAETFGKMAEANPTKYANLRVEAYTQFLSELKFIDELMEKLAGFLGACDDASSNHDKMLVVSKHIGTIYEAQMEFERRSHELQEMDKNFVTMMQKIDNPNMPEGDNVPEVIAGDDDVLAEAPTDSLTDDEKEALKPQVDNIKEQSLPELKDEIPTEAVTSIEDVAKA